MLVVVRPAGGGWRPRGVLRRVLTEMVSRLIVSPENMETSAMLRISLTDCLVVARLMLSPVMLVMLEKSDMRDMSEVGR